MELHIFSSCFSFTICSFFLSALGFCNHCGKWLQHGLTVISLHLSYVDFYAGGGGRYRIFPGHYLSQNQPPPCIPSSKHASQGDFLCLENSRICLSKEKWTVVVSVMDTEERYTSCNILSALVFPALLLQATFPSPPLPSSILVCHKHADAARPHPKYLYSCYFSFSWRIYIPQNTK